MDDCLDDIEEEVLAQLELTDAIHDLDKILAVLADNWAFGSDGMVRKGNKLELHTYGWSGNEEMIEALMKNMMFFSLYWEKSTRGGHYYFKLRKIK